MITGGDAKFWPPPQFGFAFQFKAEVFSVRVDYLVRLLFYFCRSLLIQQVLHCNRHIDVLNWFFVRSYFHILGKCNIQLFFLRLQCRKNRRFCNWYKYPKRQMRFLLNIYSWKDQICTLGIVMIQIQGLWLQITQKLLVQFLVWNWVISIFEA